MEGGSTPPAQGERGDGGGASLRRHTAPVVISGCSSPTGLHLSSKTMCPSPSHQPLPSSSSPPLASPSPPLPPPYQLLLLCHADVPVLPHEGRAGTGLPVHRLGQTLEQCRGVGVQQVLREGLC